MGAPILSGADMNAIGAELAGLRPDSCAVTRPPAAVGVGGARKSGPYTAVATVACRVEATARQAVERIFGGQAVPQVDYLVSVPRGTDVRSNDRITVNGSVLEVVFAPRAQSFSFELAVACKATE